MELWEKGLRFTICAAERTDCRKVQGARTRSQLGALEEDGRDNQIRDIAAKLALGAKSAHATQKRSFGLPHVLSYHVLSTLEATTVDISQRVGFRQIRRLPRQTAEDNAFVGCFDVEHGVVGHWRGQLAHKIRIDSRPSALCARTHDVQKPHIIEGLVLIVPAEQQQLRIVGRRSSRNHLVPLPRQGLDRHGGLVPEELIRGGLEKPEVVEVVLSVACLWSHPLLIVTDAVLLNVAVPNSSDVDASLHWWNDQRLGGREVERKCTACVGGRGRRCLGGGN